MAERDTELTAVELVIECLIKEGFDKELIEVLPDGAALGCDIRVWDSEKVIRYVEVKGRGGTGNGYGVKTHDPNKSKIRLSRNEWLAAERYRELYWLYVVYGPLGNAPCLSVVSDPVSKLEAVGVILQMDNDGPEDRPRLKRGIENPFRYVPPQTILF